MKIKKNGIIIDLTESDIKRLSKKILKEQEETEQEKLIRKLEAGNEQAASKKNKPDPTKKLDQLKNIDIYSDVRFVQRHHNDTLRIVFNNGDIYEGNIC